jgi:hypothetical protein
MTTSHAEAESSSEPRSDHHASVVPLLEDRVIRLSRTGLIACVENAR